MPNFQVIQLPHDTPGLNLGHHASEDGGSGQKTSDPSDDKALVEAVRQKYEKEIFADLPRVPGRKLHADLSLRTLTKGTRFTEFVAPTGRTILVYRGGTPEKEIAVTIGSSISYEKCKKGSLFLVDAGTRIGMPTEEERFPTSIQFLTATFTHFDVKAPQ